MDDTDDDAKHGNARLAEGSGLSLHDGLAVRRPAVLAANAHGAAAVHSVPGSNQRLRHYTAASSRSSAIRGQRGPPVRGNDRAERAPAAGIRAVTAHHDHGAAASPARASRRFAADPRASAL